MFKQEVMSQALSDSLLLVDGPVLGAPAQEPAGEGRRFKPLFHRHSGGTRVSVGRVALDVFDSWTQTVSC